MNLDFDLHEIENREDVQKFSANRERAKEHIAKGGHVTVLFQGRPIGIAYSLREFDQLIAGNP